MSRSEVHQVYSDEVQEILGYIPHSIIRWGITIITITILVLVCASWFVKYPEIISGPITITSQNPPVDIVTRAMGRIHLLVEEGDEVYENDILGYIESSSEFADMMVMENAIDQISLDLEQEQLIDQLMKVAELRSFSLGEVQPSYESLLNQINSLYLFYELDIHQKQIEQLQKKILTYRELNQKLNDQKELLTKELTFTRNVFLSDSLLRSQDFISERDLNNSQLNLIQRQRSLEDAEIAILNNHALIRDYESQIEELMLEKRQQETRNHVELEEALKVLKSQLSAWKHNYLLQSPFRGTIAFFEYFVNNQFVQSGQPLMTVIPDRPGIFGIVNIPVTGSGRVNTNQRITISLENYPSEEYGKVLGVVEQISPLPRENTYSIRVDLPNGLQTSYGQTLDFREQMQGTADIITEDFRLLERIFHQFRSLIDQV